MTTFRLSIFLLLISTVLHSQSFNIKEGKSFEDPEKRNTITSIDFNENNYYFLRSKSNGEKLAVCNYDRKTGSIVFEKNIELQEKEYFHSVFNKNNKLLLFTGFTESKQDKKLYLLRVFDNKTGNIIGDVQVVEEIDTKNDNGGYRRFDISFSPDNKKMLTILDDKNKDGPRKVVAKLYDANTFNKIWEKQPVENYQKSTVYASSFLTDNAGNFIYLISYLRPEHTSDYDQIYAICIDSGNNTTVSFVKVPSENKTTQNLALNVFDNELTCSGEFMDGNNTLKCDATLKTTGFFVLSVNISEARLLTQSYDYLSEESLFKLGYTEKNAFYKSQVIKKENKLFKHFISFYFDGALYVVKYHGFDYNITSGYGNTNYFHHANEIIVMKYGSDKKLQWMQVIPRKTQDLENPRPSYILQVSAGTKLRLLYYDRDKNFIQFPDVNNYTPGKYIPLSKLTDKTFLTCTTIDAQGKMKREVIRDAEKMEFLDLNDNFFKTNALILKPQFDSNKKTGSIDELIFTD